MDYIHEKIVQAKADFRELLKETKLITYKSKKVNEESDQHMKDVEATLVVGLPLTRKFNWNTVC